MYVSATGATEVSNLAYAERLGIWGEGTPFANVTNFNEKMREKKIPYSKPIPRNFQAQWNEANKYDDHHVASDEIKDVISQIVESNPSVPPQKMAPSAIIVCDRVIQVQRKYLLVGEGTC